MGGSGHTSFVLVMGELSELPAVLRTAFKHPWVSSYQVGFGPPLLRATARLTERAKNARSALEKLEIYLEHCILDSEQRTRLAKLQRNLVTRRFGPVEAESLDRADVDALDLSLRLKLPASAPPEIQTDMSARGLALDEVPTGTPPDELSGRFVVHLGDVKNERLMYVDSVRRALPKDGEPACVELRVSPAHPNYWSHFVGSLAQAAKIRAVFLADPVSHARVHKDGERA